MVVGVIVGVSVGVFDGIGVLVGVAVLVGATVLLGTSVLLGTKVGILVAAGRSLALGVLVGGSVATVGRFVFVGGTWTALFAVLTPKRVAAITVRATHSNRTIRFITPHLPQLHMEI